MTDSMTDVREVIARAMYPEFDSLPERATYPERKRARPEQAVLDRIEALSDADRILSALSSHGLKVLGREPTVEMVAAGRKAEMAHASLLPVWRAMHDAAE